MTDEQMPEYRCILMQEVRRFEQSKGAAPMTSDSKWKLVPVEPTPAMAFAGIPTR